MDMKILPNEFGPIKIQIVELVDFICIGGPSVSKLRVRYIANEKLMEFISFKGWLNENIKKGTAESVGSTVYKYLDEKLEPIQLEVSMMSTTSVHHGLAFVKIGQVDW